MRKAESQCRLVIQKNQLHLLTNQQLEQKKDRLVTRAEKTCWIYQKCGKKLQPLGQYNEKGGKTVIARG